jgi:hypothetical protein
MEQTKKDKIFADGMFFKNPAENAPEFVKGKISIKTTDFIAFLHKHSKNGWVNLDLKQSPGGKMYFELDNWTPKKEEKEVPKIERDPKNPEKILEYPTEEIDPSDIPF